MKKKKKSYIRKIYKGSDSTYLNSCLNFTVMNMEEKK